MHTEIRLQNILANKYDREHANNQRLLILIHTNNMYTYYLSKCAFAHALNSLPDSLCRQHSKIPCTLPLSAMQYYQAPKTPAIAFNCALTRCPKRLCIYVRIYISICVCSLRILMQRIVQTLSKPAAHTQ